MTVDFTQPGEQADQPASASTAGRPTRRDTDPTAQQATAERVPAEQVEVRGSDHPLRQHREGTPMRTALADIRGSLSPSRAADFKTCPLLYRFRTIDRLPDTPTRDQVRGTLVHAVLERLFELPAAQRTPTAAGALVEPEWQRLQESDPALGALFQTDADSCATPAEERAELEPLAAVREWLDSARGLLDGYFTVEDPQRLEPAERESLIEVVLDSGLRLRGFVDRLDISPAGDMRVVDYKTGAAPREAFEARALFQLKFYALVLWRTRGTVPRALRLLYLRDREACDYRPDAEELGRFEKNLVALWTAIDRATQAGDFPAKRSRLCDWCAYQQLCPEFGGTPPPFPVLAES